MKTKTFTPIAMRCTQEQWNELKRLLKINGIEFYDIYRYDCYLTNNFRKERTVRFVSIGDYCDYNGELHETFDADLFLRCCGVEVEEQKCTNTCDVNCTYCDENQSQPWQPKYGDIVEVSDDDLKWFDNYIYVAPNPINTNYHVVMQKTGGALFNWLFVRQQQQQQQPNYAKHIRRIKSEAEKHGKNVNVKIEEV